MPLARTKQRTIAEVVSECDAAVLRLVDAAGKALLYEDECLRLAKLARRLGQILGEPDEAQIHASTEGFHYIEVRIS